MSIIILSRRSVRLLQRKQIETCTCLKYKLPLVQVNKVLKLKINDVSRFVKETHSNPVRPLIMFC